MRSSFASCSSQGHLNCLVLAVAATLGGMVLEPAGAHAQGIIRAEAAPDRVTVDIPPGRLSGVLETYANQAGVLLSADSRFLAGLNSPGLRGTFEVEHGFAALLRSHDLEVQRNAQGIYVLRALPANPGRVAELDAVEVTGQLSEADRPFQTAGSAQYISRDQIERFRGSSVGDIFQGTPGVLVAENRNSGGLDVNIRGMQGQGRVPVLLMARVRWLPEWRRHRQPAAAEKRPGPDLRHRQYCPAGVAARFSASHDAIGTWWQVHRAGRSFQ